ncbi:MAG: hypothetical protein Q9182_003643 [Xanthomendoza sp. 2 TL-2023]
MAKSGKSKKTANDGTPVAPKDIKGDVTTENELSPQDASAPRSTRKRHGDFNDFENDDAITAPATEDTRDSPTQPKKKTKTVSPTEKKAKPSKTDAPAVRNEKTHPGDDMAETEPTEDSTAQKTSGRKAGAKKKAARGEVKSTATEDNAATEDAAIPQGEAAPTKQKADAATKRKSSAEKRTKPSKVDGHPVVTEKTHPGGDTVETEIAEASILQQKMGKNVKGKAKATSEVGKAEAQKEEVAPTKKAQGAKKSKSSAKNNDTEKAEESSKSKPDSNKSEQKSHSEEIYSQAQAVHKVTAPKKTKEVNPAEPDSKPQKSKKAPAAKPKADAARGKDTARTKAFEAGKDAESKNEATAEDLNPDAAQGKSMAPEASKDAKSKDEGMANDVDQATEKDTAAVPDQAMDEIPFKKLLKRERAKIPSVKASANAAEAERKAQAASKANRTSDKPGRPAKAKQSKPAVKDKKTAATETPGKSSEATEPKGRKRKAASGATDTEEPKPAAKGQETEATEAPAKSSKATAPKGKKRKDGPEAAGTKVDAAPSEKKPKKARTSALGAATSAVEDFINSGIEAAAQGVSVVKDLAAGFGAESVADNITAVAEGVIDEKAQNETAEKGAANKATKADKGKGKEKAVEDAAETNEFDDDESNGEDDSEEGDQTLALIKGFESEEENEGPGMGEGFKEGQEVPKLPKNKEVQKQLKAATEDSGEPGVVYVGRIPHGFYESQMRAYFGQFGDISRLRLSRNRTTGNSKHYAFIEFSSAAVAKIVAATMDNYLMFGHILKCKVVPAEDVHENLWKGANKRFKKVPWSKIEGKKLEKKVGREEWGRRVEGERKKREKKGEKLKSIGYEFEAPKLKGPEDVPIREGEKAIEGPSAEAEVVEEKTIVTTDGGNGSIVISEEVKTKVKKGGKRKAEEKVEEGPLAEVVKKAKKAKNSVA